MNADDTIIAAQVTPSGVGGVAIIRVSGAGCAQKVAPLFATPPHWKHRAFTVSHLVSPQESDEILRHPVGMALSVAGCF